MARTLSDEDVEAIAQRTAALMVAATVATRKIEPDAVYSVEEAARLAAIHPVTLREKLRTGVIRGSRRLGEWRVRGAELLRGL